MSWQIVNHTNVTRRYAPDLVISDSTSPAHMSEAASIRCVGPAAEEAISRMACGGSAPTKEVTNSGQEKKPDTGGD